MSSEAVRYAPEHGLIEQMQARYAAAHVVGRTAALVYWDERVMMPLDARHFRVHQRSWISGRAHELLTDPQLRDAAERVREHDPNHREACAILRDVEYASRRPVTWIERQAAATAAARGAWSDAQGGASLKEYLRALGEVVELARQESSFVGWQTEPYDALLDSWEPGLRASDVVPLIVDVVQAAEPLRDAAPYGERDLLLRDASSESKAELERRVVHALGFDMSAGRVDVASRAFCITLGPRDVRIVSRFGCTPGIASLTSTMHEAGHGIYAQSLHLHDLPGACAQVPGVAIDESQARLFENHVGLHPGFLDWIRVQAADCLDAQYRDIDPAQWLSAWHGRASSALRVGADELDYDAHILVRTMLERALINGELEVDDLPSAWQELSHKLLPHINADLLSDVHWSIGQFGYFPCYTLGNIWAAQIMRAVRSDVPDLDSQLAHGDTTSLRAWLNEAIYQHGCTRAASDIMYAVSGGTDTEPMRQHLTTRFGGGSCSRAL